MNFDNAVSHYKSLRAKFDQRKVLKREFELFVRFEEETYYLWALYQQTVIGNINVPKLDFQDPREKSWMWAWIHGNRRWQAWNKLKGIEQDEASRLFIEEVVELDRRLPALVEYWKKEQDPRIPESELKKAKPHFMKT